MAKEKKGNTLKLVVIGTTVVTWIFLIVVLILSLNVVFGDSGYDEEDESDRKVRSHHFMDPIIYLIVLVITILGSLGRSAVLMYIVSFLTFVMICIQLARIQLTLNNDDIDEDNDFRYGIVKCEQIFDLNDASQDIFFDDEVGDCKTIITFRFFALFGLIFNLVGDTVLACFF